MQSTSNPCRRTVLASLFGLFVVSAALAENLSLSEAQTRWQRGDKLLQIARLGVQAAEGDLRQADSRPNPTLSWGATSINPRERLPDGNRYGWRADSVLGLQQLLERGDKRGLRKAVAESMLNASRQDLLETVRQRLQSLRQGYYDLKLAQEKLRIQTETEALYQQAVEAGRLRFRVGDISGNDLSRLRIERNRAANDTHQAKAEWLLAQRQLLLVMGLVPETKSLNLVATDQWPALSPVQEMEAVVDASERPDLMAAQARLEAADKARDLARAQKTRDLTVGVQYERNPLGTPTNSYGLGVSVPLFIGHAYEGAIARAEAEYLAALVARDQVVAALMGQLGQARQDLLASTERLRRLDGEIYGEAEQVAKSAEFAYSRGAMNLMDVLDARRVWRQVQLEAATARADYAKAQSAWQLQMMTPTALQAWLSDAVPDQGTH